MDEAERLKAAAAVFRRALQEAAATDGEAASILGDTAPRLARIARGEVTPPAEGLYRRRFCIEQPRHGSGSVLFDAQASFMSALEDWRSKPWYPK